MPAFAAWKMTSLANGVGVTTDNAIASDLTLTPDGIDANGVARFVDQTVTVPIGRTYATVSCRKPVKGSSVHKVVVKLFMPTLETPSPSQGSGFVPAPTLAYTHSMSMEIMLPVRGTDAERVKFHSYLRSMFQSTINAMDGAPSDATGQPLGAMIRYLESIY